MKDLLSTNGLTKKFGRYKVVNAVNIHIRQGDYIWADWEKWSRENNDS